MIPHDVGFHPVSKKITTLLVGSILLINVVVSVSSHKCFVCGPPPNTPNVSENESIPSCDRFDPNNSIFIRECSEASRGCSIQTNGTILTRTCEEIAVLDCKKANNVEYCYCKSELCNKWHPTKIDDEDNEPEGSGQKIHTDGLIPILTDVTRQLTPTRTTPIHVTEAIPANTSTKNSLNSYLFIIFISIFYSSVFLFQLNQL